MKVLLRPRAKQDLSEQTLYIARDSLIASNRFLVAVQKLFAHLAKMPNVGAPCKFRNARLAGARVAVVPGFKKILVFYRTTKSEIEIIRIIHGARNLQELL